MRLLIISITLVAQLLLVACSWSPPKPILDYNPEYAFSSVKTYAIVSQQSEINTLLEGRIQSALEAGLNNKGLHQAAANEADILVRFMVSAQDKQKINTYDQFYGGAYRCWRCGYPGYSTEVQVVNYTEGQLVVDFVDPTEKRAFWRAVSKGRIDTHKTPEEREQRIRAVVDAMLAEYPPQK